MMPTQKNRVNLTVDSEVFAALGILAKRKRKSLSNVSIDLITRALELEEDFYFSSVSDRRLSEEKKRISHDKAWDL